MPATEFATGIPDSDAVFNWIHVEGSVNHQILTLVVISLKAGRLARKTTTRSADCWIESPDRRSLWKYS